MSSIDETGEVVLVKSEKVSQKKKKRLVCIVAVIAIITTIVSFVVDYSGYRKGQAFALASEIATVELSPSLQQIDWNAYSYEERCKLVYDRFRPLPYYYGSNINYSNIRRQEEEMRSAFAEIMKNAGFDRYDSYNIANWFRYTNFVDYYFLGHYWCKIISLSCYIIVAFAIVYMLFVNREAKKEIVVYENSVLCRINPKKSKQIVFDDINNLDIEKNSLKLVGANIKYKILNLTNAEEIKSLIIDKKKSTQIVTNGTILSVPVSSVGELKKYKELLDVGVISQEEFDSKKNQILENIVRIKISPLKSFTGFNWNQKVSISSGIQTLWQGNVGETAEIYFEGPTSITVKYHISLMHYGGECSGIIDPAKSKKYNVSARQGIMSTKIVLQPVDVFDAD